MRIYGFETFKENCENVKAIKFKKWEDITNYCKFKYNKDFLCWGKKFKATYNRKNDEFINVKIYINDVFKISYHVTFNDFNDTIEYVEINNSIDLEIE